MHISWNWLSELVDLSRLGGPKELAELLTKRGLEIEEIRSMSKGFEKVITAQILELNPHPQADRLSLCKVTIGQGEVLEIVCGAQNMKAGDKVALAQIGAKLPNGMTIVQSKIRGIVSNGMLCSEEELGLKDKSEGILILAPETPLGRPLAEILGRDDTVLTFKLTSNRGDCLSHFGMAREIAAATGQSLRRPEGIKVENYFKKGLLIKVSLEAGELSPQFWGCIIEGVKIGPSPAWVVRRLETLGHRSINNVVDATNLVMLELGHPLHAYDADRIEGEKICVRMSREGEQLPLLDAQTVTLAGSELVIADAKRAVGLAGVMGGGNSEVQVGTTRVFLECAEFSPAHVRRAAARHQRHTDAAHRFERGVDPLGLSFAIGRLAQLVIELAGGEIQGAVAETLPSRDSQNNTFLRRIQVRPGYFSEFLGVSLKTEQVEKTLCAHECVIEKTTSDEWTVVPPSYRLDLALKEDLAEEVARSIGYDKIPATIPRLTTPPAPLLGNSGVEGLAKINKAKDSLVRSGLLETINFAFTSDAWLRQFGMSATARVMNPLSEEHEALAPSLLPGLVRNALDNWRHHFGSESLAIRLFELRPTFQVRDSTIGIAASGEMDTGVEERWRLALVLSGPRLAGGLRNEQVEVDFYDLKGVIESLFEALGTRGIRFQPLASSRNKDQALIGLFHPGKSVEILAGNQVGGILGLMHPGKSKELKTRAPLWLAELDWEVLSKLSMSAFEPHSFKAWPEFPSMERDFALLVRDEITADKITQTALRAGRPLAKGSKIFDIYRGSQVPEGMTSVAVRVIFFDETRSLQESETEAVSARILEAWKKELGAELRMT